MTSIEVSSKPNNLAIETGIHQNRDNNQYKANNNPHKGLLKQNIVLIDILGKTKYRNRTEATSITIDTKWTLFTLFHKSSNQDRRANFNRIANGLNRSNRRDSSCTL